MLQLLAKNKRTSSGISSLRAPAAWSGSSGKMSTGCKEPGHFILKMWEEKDINYLQ